MIKEYHQQLMDEKEKWREQERLEREVAALSKEKKQLANKEEQLRQRLEEEKVDVEKLEGLSIVGLFTTLIGKKDEKLEQEKQEVVSAQLKWQEAMEARVEVAAEVSELQKRIQSLGSPKVNYHELLMKKQQYLVNNNEQDGQQALDLMEKVGNLKADKKEIIEALEAGKSAAHALSAALDSLEKAKNWGTLDMFGGGMISTSIKHSNIDAAKQQVHRAQSLLRKFAHELDDIGHTFQVDLSISGGLTFMDYFFDGLISDWLVQDKINNSMNQVRDMYNQTKQTIHQLERLLTDVEKTIQSLENEWKRLLETTV